MKLSKAKICFDHDRLLVSGVIDFITAVDLWKDSLSLLVNCQKIVFDFSQVTATNSAALALLIEWLKWAKCEKKPISFQNLPPQLVSIASVAGIENILISS